MLSRIGTFGQQQLILDATLRTQGSLVETQLQLATGKKTQQFSGIPQDTPRLVNLKNEMARSEQFLLNITHTERRLELMNFSLEGIDELGREMRSVLRNSLHGDAANTINLPNIANQFLAQAVDLLNQRDDSRHLFAGGRTDTLPVDLGNGVYTAPAPPPFDPTPDTGYYQGDATIQEVRIDETFVLQYGVTADESAFEKIIRALDSIAQITFSSPITPAENQVIDDAITALSEALDNNGLQKTVSDFSADVSLKLRTLDAQRDKHNDFINFAIDSIADIKNEDTAETISKLNFQQVQLEASFQLIARVTSLSLSNFLR